MAMLRVSAFYVLLMLAVSVSAGDRQREISYAQDLTASVVSGRIVWLASGEQRFLGLMIEAEKADNRDAVLILHDMGEHPDHKPLIHGLRTVLPQYDWATLAIQLPLREMGAGAEDYFGLFDEARSRILAAIEFLRANGAQNIAVVGVGVGAAMAAYSISIEPNGLFALAAISLPLPNSGLPQAKVGDFIKNIALPILDIYAEFDVPDVVETARQRRMLAKDNPVYRQIKISGEDHAYRYNPNLVIKRVYSWLDLNLRPN